MYLERAREELEKIDAEFEAMSAGGKNINVTEDGCYFYKLHDTMHISLCLLDYAEKQKYLTERLRTLLLRMVHAMTFLKENRGLPHENIVRWCEDGERVINEYLNIINQQGVHSDGVGDNDKASIRLERVEK